MPHHPAHDRLANRLNQLSVEIHFSLLIVLEFICAVNNHGLNAFPLALDRWHRRSSWPPAPATATPGLCTRVFVKRYRSIRRGTLDRCRINHPGTEKNTNHNGTNLVGRAACSYNDKLE